MKGLFRVGVCVSASALALMMALSARVETQNGLTETAVTTATAAITDAPTGFEVASNGFAEEFCAQQEHLTNSPNSPEIEADECTFDSAVIEFSESQAEDDGVGPVFNATGCGECHIAPALGGAVRSLNVAPGSSMGRISSSIPADR
jgi:CxxC motif-containing protein (DUF1111 family)